MKGKNLLRYLELNVQWLGMRDDPNVSEEDKDAHLDRMDVAWWNLTDEEQNMVDEEARQQALGPRE